MIGLIICLLLPTASTAVVILADNQTPLSTPVADDVFATGDTVVIDAPVDSLVAAGGRVVVNAPVKGDVIAAGGSVSVNANVGGKVIAAGGVVEMNGSVGTNLILTGGKVDVLNTTTVHRDALLSGGAVTNAGTINGTLRISGSNVKNTGTAANTVIEDSKTSVPKDQATGGQTERHGNWDWIGTIASMLNILMALGFLVIGLVLLALFPGAANSLGDEILHRSIRTLLIGIVGLIGSVIVLLLLLISLVGIPLALIEILFLATAVLISGLVTSLALGRWLGGMLKVATSPFILFIAGFVVLNLLELIPILGGLVGLVSLLFGTGAIFSAVLELVQNRNVPA